MFVDEADIHVAAGHGGSGALSFRREKFVPRGGPDGGNGGKGGSVVLVADPHRNTLVHFRFTPEFAAERGRQGQGALKTGREGIDLEIPVPVGTTVLVHDPAVPRDEALLLDLQSAGDLGIRRSVKALQLPEDAFAYLAPRQRVAYFFEPTAVEQPTALSG